MAKMFYTLEEAAMKLHTTPDQVKEMVSKGQLQEFRDRDKLMFKVEQVDLLAPEAEPDLGMADLGGSGAIPLADSGGGSALDLQSSGSAFALAPEGSAILSPTLGGSGVGIEGPKERSGISVFDIDDTDSSDPAAVTQVTDSGLDDATLEAVGSGSGLMDMTRESDDTSLGAAALLDEIYQGEQQQPGETVGASGLFEATGAESDEASGVAALAGVGGVAMVAAEPYDGAGSGLVGGLSIGMVAALGLSLAVVMMGVLGAAGAQGGLVGLVSSNPMMYVGIVAGVTLLAGLGGFFLGKRS